MSDTEEFKSLEIDLLLEGIFQGYGYDFRNYDSDFVRGKLMKRMQLERVRTIPRLQEKVLRQRDCLNRILNDFTANGSLMFDQTDLYVAFRKKVVPQLKTYPSIRIWQVGCSGIGAYALAMIMEDEGLGDRYKIYATDISERSLETSKQGVFPSSDLRQYERYYLRAGGQRSFANYCVLKSKNAFFKPFLKKNIIFHQHNLSSDQSFNEFNTIFSGNVTEHFNQSLRDKVFCLFHASTCMYGFLALGKKETLASTPCESCYEPSESAVKLYRRIR